MNEMNEQTPQTAAQLQAQYDAAVAGLREFDSFTQDWDRQNQRDRMAALDDRKRERADLVDRKGQIHKALVAAERAEREAAGVAGVAGVAGAAAE